MVLCSGATTYVYIKDDVKRRYIINSYWEGKGIN